MASIAVIGSGFVGQANGKVLATQGHSVLFIDIDPTKIAHLREEGYQATSFAEFPSDVHVDVFFISVPTPTVEGKAYLEHLKQAAESLGKILARYSTHPIIILKSTVPPGTTTNVLIPLLEQHSGKKEGVDFGVAFEPEYLREKTSLEDAAKPRFITIGSHDDHTACIVAWLRAPFHCTIKKMQTEEAEMQKYVHNLFNATKISFFNEMRQVCKELHLDDATIFEITAQTAEASWNPRYGIRDFGPYDGTCLPKDTAAFLAYAREKLGKDLPLLASVIAVNEALEQENTADMKPGASPLAVAKPVFPSK